MKFEVLNNKGQKVVGIADYQKHKAPAVIICHGFKGAMEEKHYSEIARILFQAGFSVFRFDFTNGVGESDGNIEDITVTQEIQDLKAIVNFVYNNINVDKPRIGLVGHSLGGLVAVSYAMSDERIKAVALLAPVSRVDITPSLSPNPDFILKWKKQSYQTFVISRNRAEVKVKYSFYEDAKRYDAKEEVTHLRTPLLIVHGDRDGHVPLEHSKEMYAAAREPKKFIIIKGADHPFIIKEKLDEAATKIADWFNLVLK